MPKQEVTHPSPVTEKYSGLKNSLRHLRTAGWFFFGGLLGLFFFTSFVFIYFKLSYADVVYPGVYVDNIDFGGKSKDDVKNYFSKKNAPLDETEFILTSGSLSATTSAQNLNLGYDEELLAEQAFMLGRSENTLSNISLIFQAYMQGVKLEPSYTFSDEVFEKAVEPFRKSIDKEPINAQFNFQDGRVTAFKPSTNGEKVDVENLKEVIRTKAYVTLQNQKSDRITIAVPKIIVEPEVTTEKVNNLGIKELIGRGTSEFRGSIPNRVFNINHAASKLNGVLVPPGETFSFVKQIGDISKLTGYKEAYIIQGGRTVLGDGGGVCQVSTTLFRAILNSGLPVVERNQHAYRVQYYEQDMPPGVDAAIYVPTVDLKFKNDTKHHILIQTIFDAENYSLTFELYGTSDGRVAQISEPVITSQTPAPEPVYQDDPTLPKDQIKQVDWAAPGATVYFTRTVTRDGKTLIEETFNSRYRPWQAVYLKGTKEG